MSERDRVLWDNRRIILGIDKGPIKEVPLKWVQDMWKIILKERKKKTNKRPQHVGRALLSHTILKKKQKTNSKPKTHS